MLGFVVFQLDFVGFYHKSVVFCLNLLFFVGFLSQTLLFFVVLPKISCFLHLGTFLALSFYTTGENMKKININDVPQLLSSNQISIKEAVNIIWSEIYTKPYVYGLENFDEDEKSDFLLQFHKKIPLLIKRYDKNLGNFSNFIRGCIHFTKISWKKMQRRHELPINTTDNFLINKSNDEYLQVNDSNQIEFLQNLDNFSNQNEEDNKEPEQNEDSECKTKIKILTVLALTLKACRDVDDKLISKISKYTGMNEDALHNLVQEMKNNEIQNDGTKEKLIAKRNNAFYFHRKYKTEMEQPGISDSSYENLKSRYERQTKNWIKSSRLLAKRGTLGPSNAEIAKKLGLKPRTVGFYLFCAKKNLIKNDSDLNTENAEDNDSLDKN